MAEISLTHSGAGIEEVLNGLGYPSQRWQIVAHAQYWGVTDGFIAELMQLPIREYRDLGDVATTLGDRRRVREMNWRKAAVLPRLPSPRRPSPRLPSPRLP